MGVRVPYDKLKQDVKQIFLNLGLTDMYSCSYSVQC